MIVNLISWEGPWSRGTGPLGVCSLGKLWRFLKTLSQLKKTVTLVKMHIRGGGGLEIGYPA